MPRNEVD